MRCNGGAIPDGLWHCLLRYVPIRAARSSNHIGIDFSEFEACMRATTAVQSEKRPVRRTGATVLALHQDEITSRLIASSDIIEELLILARLKVWTGEPCSERFECLHSCGSRLHHEEAHIDLIIFSFAMRRYLQVES